MGRGKRSKATLSPRAQAITVKDGGVAESQGVEITLEQVLEALERHGKPGRVKATADDLGVSPTWLYAYLRDAGLSLRPPRPSEAILKAAWVEAEGNPTRVAEIIGRGKTQTRLWLDELKLPLNVSRRKRTFRKKWDEADDNRIVLEYRHHRRQGELAELAAELGVSVDALKTRARKLGVTDGHQERWLIASSKSLSEEQLDALIDDFGTFPGLASEWQRSRALSYGEMEQVRNRRASDYQKLKRSKQRHFGRSAVALGANFEEKSRASLEKLFRRFGLKHMAIRSHPLSYGAADISVAGYGKTYEIQAETTGSWRPKKWNRLYGWCQMQEAVPLVVREGRDGRPEFFLVTGRKREGTRNGEPMPMVPFDWELEATKLKGLETHYESLFSLEGTPQRPSEV